MISVQKDDFNVGFEYQNLRSVSQNEGAIVFFVGLVRDMNADGSVQAMEIEHYPGMTENVLSNIALQAKERWDLQQVKIIHRFGRLEAAEQIVFVATSSVHREAAFAACEFIMDFLKTKAPFWKKELNDQGDVWVEAKESDELKLTRW